MDKGTASTTRMDITLKSSAALALHYIVLVWVTLLPFKYSSTYQRVTGTWADHFLQWDGTWYSLIGQYGYHQPEKAQVILSHSGNKIPITPVEATSFFPLLPTLVHWIGVIGTLALTNLLFVASVFMLGVWLKRHELSVGWGVLLFALNPAAVFQSSLYPEPFIVFFALCAMLLSGKKSRLWWLAAICGFLSSLTAGLGAVIGVFCLDFFRRKEWIRGTIHACSVAAGWVVYAIILARQGIQPLAFLGAEKLWDRVWRLPLAAWFGQFQRHMFIGYWDQIFVAFYVGMLVSFVILWSRRHKVVNCSRLRLTAKRRELVTDLVVNGFRLPRHGNFWLRTIATLGWLTYSPITSVMHSQPRSHGESLCHDPECFLHLSNHH